MAKNHSQGSKNSSDTNIVQKWPFLVCAVVIIGSLVGILGVLLNPKTSAVLQARLACIFVFFAIACVMGILFLRSTEKSEVGGKLGVWKIAIIGPGAFFLACLILYNQFFHEDVLQLSDPLSLKVFADLIRDTEKRSGWLGYNEWQRSIKSLAPEIAQNDEKTIETFLSAVYYRGDDSHKLDYPFLQTIWIYGKPDSDGNIDTIKIARISGRWEQDTPRIFAESKGTTIASAPTSMLFVKHLNSDVIVIPNYVSPHGIYQPDPNWHDIADYPADCLLVTRYHEPLPGGDYVLIDPSKYITTESRGAMIEFSVLAASPMSEPQLWEMRGDGAAYPGEVPLLFREFKSASQPDSATPSWFTNHATEDLEKWLSWLDEKAEKDPTNEPDEQSKSAILFLRDIRTVLRTTCNNNLVTFQASLSQDLVGTFAYRLNKIKNPVIATFLWKDKTMLAKKNILDSVQMLGQSTD
jgi:hypothetical protein